MTFKHGIFGVTDNSGVRPMQMADTSFAVVVGTAPDADAETYPLNKPVLVAGNIHKIAKLDMVGNNAGTLPDALEAVYDQKRCAIAIIRVEEGVDAAATILNIIGGVDPVTGAKSGIEAILDVQSITGKRPRLLHVPDFLKEQAVLTKLLPIATRLRCKVFGECPGTTYEEAVAYRQLWGDKRLELFWPRMKNAEGRLVPMSSYMLGLEIQKDQDPNYGYSASISNLKINGTLGTEIPIDYADGDTNCMAHLLNENQITTVILDDGYRSWGNLSCSDDPKWQFNSHVRVNDMILDMITTSLKWARDRKILRTFVEDVTDSVQQGLDGETRAGHLYGATAWADPDLNPPESIIAGNFYLDYDFTPPGIAQNITVTSHFINDYADVIFE
ncbi:phage tail sheath C-terminal domain-containing protein [Vibrio plantisponsor]|uniref:Phage tail sheath C-terminal domain-containing protein n=1 Tax=Vibrio plantisponsor TaxID=664643 RepID=A0ABU4IGZ7_9VIBR|nr:MULTISPECIES: phage tail sheath C-terminal domain-containing protein [Vibrio]EKO3963154.1 phage tail protein [Vibrio fluvialis]MDW6017635.1 phage tail sheath C-terminal domain-containing protein [Vibrio plantisponsor]NNM40470.1 phage tail protein [Vibrio plantisponsor]